MPLTASNVKEVLEEDEGWTSFVVWSLGGLQIGSRLDHLLDCSLVAVIESNEWPKLDLQLLS